MKKLMNWLKNEESGRGMVEYGLIIVLIAVALIAALNSLEGGISGAFSKASSGLNKTN